MPVCNSFEVVAWENKAVHKILLHYMQPQAVKQLKLRPT